MKKLCVLVLVSFIGLVAFSTTTHAGKKSKHNRHNRNNRNRYHDNTIEVTQGPRLGDWAFRAAVASAAAARATGVSPMYGNIGGQGSTVIMRSGRPLRHWMSYEPSEVYYKYDVNSDGRLDDSEKATMRNGMQQNPPPWSLKQFDVNNDGTLSDEEMRAIPQYRLDS